MGKNGSVKRAFSASAGDYRLLEEVGYGAHAVVYRAIYLPTDEFVAVKSLDLDRVNSSLDDVRKEAQTMSLIDHPNVIRAFCSFVVEHSLWVVMPFMAEGSCLHLMKIAYPDGFEEPVIASVLKETLKALDYLHRQGHIHRDVKAGNILVDKPGVVKLGDFGVSACMFDKGDRQRSRNTLVGTPCWMAPEVLQPGAGYDFKADIWSFGITALELAHGHAPFSKYPPMKILLMTLQNAPPGLDYDRDRRFSKAFKEMVAMCLVKDQTKRPTAEKLLKHSFFKSSKPPESTLKNIIADLPPLWDRVKALQLKDAAQLALKRMPSFQQEALSMSEYQRGVSAWNFDIDDLKAQASLIREDNPPEIKEHEENFRAIEDDKQDSTSCQSTSAKQISPLEISCRETTSSTIIDTDVKCSSTIEDSVPEGRNDVYDKPRTEDPSVPSTSKLDNEQKQSRCELRKKQQAYSGPLVYSGIHNNSTAERARGSERSDGKGQLVADKYKHEVRKQNFSGPLSLPNRASANSLSAPIRTSGGGYVDSLGAKNKRNLVEVKGRFSVTSENVDLAQVQEIPIGTLSRRSTQGSPLRKSASVGEWNGNPKSMQNNQHLKELCNNSVAGSILIPHLQNLVQQTTLQQDLIMNLLGSLQQNSFQHSEIAEAACGGMPSQAQSIENDSSVETGSSQRERALLVRISELQARMISLTDELIGAKLKHVQLQQELSALYCREEIEETGHEEVEEG